MMSSRRPPTFMPTHPLVPTLDDALAQRERERLAGPRRLDHLARRVGGQHVLDGEAVAGVRRRPGPRDQVGTLELRGRRPAGARPPSVPFRRCPPASGRPPGWWRWSSARGGGRPADAWWSWSSGWSGGLWSTSWLLRLAGLFELVRKTITMTTRGDDGDDDDVADLLAALLRLGLLRQTESPSPPADGLSCRWARPETLSAPEGAVRSARGRPVARGRCRGH